MNFRDIFSELRRRRVFRVAAVYAGVAFVVWQATAIAFPALHLPEWMVTAVVALTIAGFPIALVLAWAFDITPGGVVRTEDVPPLNEPPLPQGAHAGWNAQRIAAVGGILVLALAGGAFVLFGGSFERAVAPEPELDRSIAVLPFSNLSAEADNEYFSDGITEDILTRLSRVAGMRVTSRTSVMGYKGTTKNLRQIGEELGVAHILEGSVRRSGDRVRISAQLINAHTDEHLWSESYDRRLDDIFAIQSEIATAIAGALQLRLSAGERSRLARAPTGSVTAYDLYLRGREYLDRNTSGMAEARANWTRAIALFRQALAEDETFYLAHVGLAQTYLWHQDLPVDERRDSVILHGRRALAGDPELAEAHVHMATAHAMTGDEEAAQREFQRALELAPNNAEVVGSVARHHAWEGRFDEAIRLHTRAVGLDPNMRDWYAGLYWSYRALGDLEQAEAWARRQDERFPHPAWLHSVLGDLAMQRGDLRAAEEQYRLALSHAPEATWALLRAAELEVARGNYEAAKQYLARAVAMAGDDDIFLLQRAVVALRTGERARAEELLRRGETRVRRRWEECAGTCVNHVLATYHALQGRREEALHYLQRAVNHGWRDIQYDSRLGTFDSLADEPRYQRLIAQVRADLERQRASLARERL